MKLRDYGYTIYSHREEDGMIEETFNRIGTTNKKCIEFGARDGLNSSNTAVLWKDQDWNAFLIEADPQWMQQLRLNTAGSKGLTMRAVVEPEGEFSIGTLAEIASFKEADLLSIDIDGNDYHIFESLTMRPRVVIVEHNPTFPVQIDFHAPYSENTEMGVGASARAIVRVGKELGYELIGMTECNCFFVLREEANKFDDLERDLLELAADYSDFIRYTATDYYGHTISLGRAIYNAGVDRDPYSGELFINGEVVHVP